jgi:hypothetical protein
MAHHGMTFEEAARTWKRFNWNLQLMLRTVPRRRKMQIRYEDLCANTEKTLARISRLRDDGRSFEVRPLDKTRFHNIGGNPMRFRRSEVDIVADERWRQLLTSADASAFERICGRMNREFGYGDGREI